MLRFILLTVLLLGPMISHAEIEWSPYNVDIVEQNSKQHKLTLISFHADWCPSCRLVEGITYKNKALSEYIKTHGITALRIDMTERNVYKSKILSIYGGYSIPFAVLLNRQGQVARRLSGIFKAKDIMQAFDDLRSNEPPKVTEKAS